MLIGAIEIKLNLGELNAGGIAMEIKTAKNEPYPVEVIKDQTYYWCTCGLSESQPFCDSSHQRT